MHLATVCLLMVCAALAACTSGSQASLNTIKLALGADTSGATSTPVNPNFRYLKVTSFGRPSYLVLGYVEPNNTEVWYSAKGEVLKTFAGRLQASVGLEEDWRHAAAMSPSWQEVLSTPGQVWQFERQRDLMPGYRTVREFVRLQEVQASVVQQALGPAFPNFHQVRWFTESTASLPVAFYALNPQGSSQGGEPQVVFSYQCLKVGLCVSFSPWSVASASASAVRP
jgi:hypothetical protein